MKLSELIGSGTIGGSGKGPEVEFTAVTEDSRRVRPGTIFFALRGGKVDGHDYISAARDAGAIAIVGDGSHAGKDSGLPYISVENPRRVLGIAAHALAGNPTRDMMVVGVTGTNGKSSTVALTKAVLETAGHPTAAFGTLGYDIGPEIVAAPHTTPFAEDLASLFARAKAAGRTHAAMEVSSHSLDQERVAGIVFTAGVFTNLTQDHLDYHRDMETYFQSKRRLLDCITARDGFMVVNIDDPYGKRLRDDSPVPCLTFGRTGDCRATNVQLTFTETRFHLTTPWGEGDVETSMLGRHNVSNALAAVTVCGGLGVDFDTLVRGIRSLNSVPGRFERVDCGQDFAVVVDYAHTDDGLRNVLQAARAVTGGRVIVVFGCGGDRDRTKRPKMAAVAAELADYAIITSDNPRTEDAMRILLDVEVGMQQAAKRKEDDYLVIADRRQAIAKAFELASPGDLVMIAGKGHEDYQIIGTTKIHFDDREVARELLSAKADA